MCHAWHPSLLLLSAFVEILWVQWLSILGQDLFEGPCDVWSVEAQSITISMKNGTWI